MNFDVANLTPFLQRIAKLIPIGFGQEEIRQARSMAGTMEHDEERDAEFSITYDGKQWPFKVHVFMDDIDAPDVHFFGPPELARQIDDEMEKFCEDLGI